MTEDAKPGLDLKPNDNSDSRIKFEQEDFNLFEETDLSKLVRMNNDESSYDDGDFSVEFDSFDEGGLF